MPAQPNREAKVEISPRDELLKITEYDCEWLFRTIAIYLSTDIPTECVDVLRKMGHGIFIGRLEDHLKRPEHPHTTALITCLIGASKCDFNAARYDTSFALTATHPEYRTVVRKILRLEGEPVERSKDTQIAILMHILPPHSKMVRLAPDTLMLDLDHILDFLDGDFEEGGCTDHYDIEEQEAEPADKKEPEGPRETTAAK